LYDPTVSEPTVPTEEAPSELVRAGRDAFGRHAWQEAFDLLTRADRENGLSGADLEVLADTAFFAGRSDVRIEVKERAFKTYQAEGDPIRAAYIAVDLANDHMLRGKTSIASGWARRAERLLDGKPETYPHGFLALIRGSMAKAAGDVPAALALAEEAFQIAIRTEHADLRATALTELAMIKIATGATAEGVGLLEEATIDAVNGELSPITAGITSCQMISACRDLTDYQRAGEWLEATDQWCERQEVSGFPGICRVHRAEIVALQGGWERAEQELRQATSELAAYDAIPPMADGLYAIGEIRRLKGDLEGAEEALRQAHALGRSPQPAMALIRLGEGKVKAAIAAIEVALAESTWDQWARARLLAAQVEIYVAAGDPSRARVAADELARIIKGYPVPALEAGAHQAMGRVLLAEGDAGAAVREMRASIRLWREVGAPYEVARLRAVLAKALRAVGGEDDADLELRAARDEFDRLGAQPDLASADADLREIADRRARRVQVRMTFVFTDIVGSTNLAEALGDEAWERLLRLHDETLRDLFARHGGTVVNSTGDGFFAAFDSAKQGITCAIAIQRALAAHRETSGFAPSVRIGIHAADATQRGADYSGLGVHVAARVAALAAGGEILVSQETLDEAGEVAASNAREIPIKGSATSLKVVAVPWT
jgi:class 3 adenylate cyclase